MQTRSQPAVAVGHEVHAWCRRRRRLHSNDHFKHIMPLVVGAEMHLEYNRIDRCRNILFTDR